MWGSTFGKPAPQTTLGGFGAQQNQQNKPMFGAPAAGAGGFGSAGVNTFGGGIGGNTTPTFGGGNTVTFGGASNQLGAKPGGFGGFSPQSGIGGSTFGALSSTPQTGGGFGSSGTSGFQSPFKGIGGLGVNTGGAFGQKVGGTTSPTTNLGFGGNTGGSTFGASNAFGSTNRNTSPSFGGGLATGAFGTVQNTGNIGFGGLGQSQPQNTGFGGFAVQQQQQTNTGVFGQSAATGAFGSASVGAFGAQNTGNTGGLAFGSTGGVATGGFGSSAFGAPQQQNTGLTFGSPLGVAGGVGGETGTGNPPFQATVHKENPPDGKGVKHFNIQVITAQKQYENKSLEELRFEDYKRNNRNGQNIAPQPSTGISFGGQQSSLGGFAGLNSGAGVNTGVFGSPSTAFGAKPATAGFGAPGTGGFGGFGSTNTAAQPTTSGFGGFGSLQQASSPFGQPQQQQQQTSAFGAAPVAGSSGFSMPGSTGAFGSTTTGGFGGFGSANTSQPATNSFGSITSSFGAPSTGAFGSLGQPQQTINAFGAPATGASAFSMPGTSTTTGAFGAPSTGAFGGFGAPTGTGAQQTSFGAFGSSFGSSTASQSPLTAGAFGGGAFGSLGGSTGTNAFGALTTFGAPSTGAFGAMPSTQPASGGLFGGFGAAAGAPSSGLGAFNLGGLGSTTTPNSFGLSGFGNQQSNTFGAQPQAVATQPVPPVSNGYNDLKIQIKDDRISSAGASHPSANDDIKRTSLLTVQRHSPRSTTRLVPRGLHSALSSTVITPASAAMGGHRSMISSSISSGADANVGSSSYNNNNNIISPLTHIQISPDNLFGRGGKKLLIKTSSIVADPWSEVLPPAPENESEISIGKQPKTPGVGAGTTVTGLTPGQSSTPIVAASAAGSSAGIKVKFGHNFSDIDDSVVNPPFLTKTDYYTRPDIDVLKKWSNYDLANVSNFTVVRKGFGEIRWDEPVDVRNINLNDILEIEHGSVSVYTNSLDKPPVGSGLNKPATIILEGIKPKNGISLEQWENRLKKTNEKNEAEFVSFSPNNNFEWEFSVVHFSRYGLCDDDMDFLEEIPGSSESVFTIISPKISPIANNNVKSVFGSSSAKAIGRMKKNSSKLIIPKKVALPVKQVISSNDNAEMDVQAPAPAPVAVAPSSSAVPKVHRKWFEATNSPCLEILNQVQREFKVKTGMPVDRESKPVDIYTKAMGAKSNGIAALQKRPVNFSLFMGRSFRVGFGPNGQIAHVGGKSIITPSASSSNNSSDVRGSTQVTIDNIDSLQWSRSFSNNTFSDVNFFCDNILSPFLKHSEVDKSCAPFTSSNSMATHWTLPSADQRDLKQYHSFLSILFLCSGNCKPKLLVNKGISNLDWVLARTVDLFNACYGQETVNSSGSLLMAAISTNCAKDARREEMISAWLQSVCAHEVPDSSGVDDGSKGASDDTYDRIFQLLTCNKKYKACEVAENAGIYQIAIMASQCDSYDEFSILANTQINKWSDNSQTSTMNSILLKIHRLFAGDLFPMEGSEFRETSILQGLGWLRGLCVIYWFACYSAGSDGESGSSNVSKLAFAIEQFNEALSYYFETGQEVVDLPSSSYADDKRDLGMTSYVGYGGAAGTNKHCLYNLMTTLFATDKSSIIDNVRLLLRSESFTRDATDYRYSFLCATLLGLCDEGLLGTGSSEFCIVRNHVITQLLYADQWKWAVYVASLVDNDFQRNCLVKDIIHRFGGSVETSESAIANAVPVYSADDLFVINSLRMPTVHIDEAIAYRYASNSSGMTSPHNLVLAVWYLQRAGDFQLSSQILTDSLLHIVTSGSSSPLLTALLSLLRYHEQLCNVDNYCTQKVQVIIDYFNVKSKVETMDSTTDIAEIYETCVEIMAKLPDLFKDSDQNKLARAAVYDLGTYLFLLVQRIEPLVLSSDAAMASVALRRRGVDLGDIVHDRVSIAALKMQSHKMLYSAAEMVM